MIARFLFEWFVLLTAVASGTLSLRASDRAAIPQATPQTISVT